MRTKTNGARGLLLAMVVAAALVAGAWTSGSRAATTCIKGSGKTITIGASLSLSGDFSADGQAFKRGYQLWVNNVNAHGGLLGCKVALDIVSDASSPAQVATNYQKLISSDHVDLVFGPFSSLLTVPSAKIANRFGYAMIEGAGGAPAVFATGLHNIFDVSLIIKNQLITSAKFFAGLPKSLRPKTAAYPTSNDPFTEPQLPVARAIMEKAGIKTVYANVFPAETTDYTPIASAVATTNADVVMLGSVDVPTVSAFIQAFAQQHYNPKAFIATAGPDQGADFLKAVGSNAEGVMVPNGWYYGYANAQSRAMVKAYVKQFGGRPADINADVAEGYAVGQVAQAAVNATHSLDQKKIISYLHSGITLQSVQGAVKFDSLGENVAAKAFTFQWQNSKPVQILPPGDPNSRKPEFPKRAWK
ncbi:MAG TPA: amino acid ABC transporter substrate-binding protein [Gaiellaceae bacterium]|nr:amino acid ABC transporter substrate-binding protein [Gaiellaceae bacterium]